MDTTNISWPPTTALALGITAAIAVLIWQRKRLLNFFMNSWQVMRKYFFWGLLNETEAETILLAIGVKKTGRKYWYFNNIFIPILIVYTPFLLTEISKDFQVIHFSKTLIELTLTGTFTMIGINVIRTNMTLVNEALEATHIPDKSMFMVLVKDAESIKSKLRSWIQLLTWTGAIAYLLEVASLIDPKKPAITPYLIGVIIMFLISVFFGRLIYVMQTNFADDESKIKAWKDSMIRKGHIQFKQLEQEGKLL